MPYNTSPVTPAYVVPYDTSPVTPVRVVPYNTLPVTLVPVASRSTARPEHSTNPGNRSALIIRRITIMYELSMTLQMTETLTTGPAISIAQLLEQAAETDRITVDGTQSFPQGHYDSLQESWFN